MRRSAVIALSLAVAACGGEPVEPARYDGPAIPWAYRPFPVVPEPSDNRTNPEKVALGRLLFYDPVLSSDRKVACATCHSEIWGLSDGLPLSVGIGGVGPTGPGRTGPNVTRRNAPTLWNVAHKPRLFWDGRAASLEEQALMPFLDPKELGRDPDAVAQELATIPEYAARFAQAFPGSAAPVSALNLARALSAFQRGFASDRAPYDQYVAGDAGALSETTRVGMQLFAQAGCHGCHVPPLFESEQYHDRGIGSGDDGRFEITGKEQDRRAFRVPTLRNVRDSEPYFHDGSVQDLRAAVAQEVQRSVEVGESPPLSDAEIDAVVTFLDKALTDRSREPHRPKTVPSGLEVPKDGFRIPR